MRRIAFCIGVMIGFFGSAQAQTGDPLTDCVNATRAVYGLHALGYDPNLAAWAAQNNSHGFGHFVMGPAARQNAAWGANTCEGVVAMWLGSPGHRAALLDSTITICGGSFNGACWTWNGGYGQPSPIPPIPAPTPMPPMTPSPNPASYPSLPCSGGSGVVVIRQRVKVRFISRGPGCLWRILHCGQGRRRCW